MSPAMRVVSRCLVHLLGALVLGCNPAASLPDDVTCPTGQLLDGETCVPEACGTGTWGDLPVDEGTVYVDVAAPEGGDGSEAAPFSSIQDGVDLAAELDGGLVVVAAGIYVETISMGDGYRDIDLRGRCKELVTIDGSGGDEVPTIEILGADKRPEVALTGLTVTGGTYTGVWVQQGKATLTRVDVRGNALVGVLGSDTELTLTDVGIYDTSPDERGDYGRGLEVEGGASLLAEGCRIEGNSDVGLFVGDGGTTADVADTSITGTLPSDERGGGTGVHIQQGAEVRLTGCTVAENTGYGVMAMDAGTTLDLRDSSVVATTPFPNGSGGTGVHAQDGAVLTATRCTFDSNAGAGLSALAEGTTVTLDDVQVLNTSAGTGAEFTAGVAIADGASLTATGCTLDGNVGAGVLASEPSTVVKLVDCAILRSVEGPSVDGDAGAPGNGIAVQNGAALSTDGCTLEGNTETGVRAAHAGTTVVLVDTRILDTLPTSNGTSGSGIQATEGATVDATGCSLQRNTGNGVLATGLGTTVTLDDTEVLDSVPGPERIYGRGVEANEGATLSMTGCTVEGNTEVGVSAAGVGTTVDLVDTWVLGTARGTTFGLALGIVAQEEGLLRASGCEVSGTDGIGVYLAAGHGQLERITVSDNRFAGIGVLSGDLTIGSSSISGTLSDDEWGGGFGIYVTDPAGASTLILSDSSIGSHDYAAVWLDGPGTFDLQRNVLSGSAGVNSDGVPLHGNAVFAENGVTAWDGATGLNLVGNTFTGASVLGVFLDASSATLEANSWSENGTDLQQQRCPEGALLTDDDLLGVPTSSVCPASNALTAYDLALTSLTLPTSETQE